MSDDATLLTLKRLLAMSAAHSEILALYLSEHVEKMPDPIEELRVISNRLSSKIEAAEGPDADHEMLAEIQREFDQIIAMTRQMID